MSDFDDDDIGDSYIHIPMEIESVVDKLRYACDADREIYIKQLLSLFDPTSGDYIGPA